MSFEEILDLLNHYFNEFQNCTIFSVKSKLYQICADLIKMLPKAFEDEGHED